MKQQKVRNILICVGEIKIFSRNWLIDEYLRSSEVTVIKYLCQIRDYELKFLNFFSSSIDNNKKKDKKRKEEDGCIISRCFNN